MEKRGEITSQQIVLLIILIISFIVILFLIFRFDFWAETESEICHNSVVMRSSGVTKEAVPLNCRRTYVCLSKDGSCERMTDPRTIKVKTKEEVFNVLAEEMADCWWMFGEGTIDFVGKDFFKKNNYCSICSQLGFDNSVEEIEGIDGEISKDEIYSYLSKTKMPDKDITYAEYFFKTKDIEKLKRVALKAEDGTDISASTFGNIDLDKQQFVIMGITSEVSGRVWKIAAGSFAGIVFAPVIGVAAGSGAIGGALIFGVAGEIAGEIDPEIYAIIVEGEGIKNNFMAPTIQEANSETLSELDCSDVVTSI